MKRKENRRKRDTGRSSRRHIQRGRWEWGGAKTSQGGEGEGGCQEEGDSSHGAGERTDRKR